MAGEIVHVEIPSRDFSRSAAFYAKLFGWKTDGVQSGGHLLFEIPGGVQGSWIRDALAQAPGPVPFVAVVDVDKTLADAEKQGGRILVQRMTLPNRGAVGLFADCDGNVLGVLSPGGGSAKREAASVPPSPAVVSEEAPGTVQKPKAATKAAAKAPVKKAPANRKR